IRGPGRTFTRMTNGPASSGFPKRTARNVPCTTGEGIHLIVLGNTWTKPGGSSAKATANSATATKNVTGKKMRCFIGLTRIRLQPAIYFCLHRGKFAGKHRKLASSDVD